MLFCIRNIRIQVSVCSFASCITDDVILNSKLCDLSLQEILSGLSRLSFASVKMLMFS